MQHTSELAERLVGIANELMQVAKSLGKARVDEPVFPESAVRKCVSGVCLRCGKTKSEVRGLFRRGNCPSCSRYVNSQIKMATVPEEAERQLIADGLLAPVNFKNEPDPVSESLAKVANAETHFADPGIPKPGRTRKRNKR